MVHFETLRSYPHRNIFVQALLFRLVEMVMASNLQYASPNAFRLRDTVFFARRFAKITLSLHVFGILFLA